jgi:SPP1 gp7 family putative phage head morphogenesis protein
VSEALRIAALRKMADEYIPEPPSADEIEAIRTVLRGAFFDAGEDALEEFEIPIAFNAADAAATLYGQQRGGELVTMITETQRLAVAALLEEAIAEGWSPQHFAKELRAGFTFSRARAAMIARTEVAIAANRGKTNTYRAAGIEYVYVYDGDFDEECQAANGSIWTVDEADANPIAHPNCVRAFRPATRSEIAEHLGNEQERAA